MILYGADKDVREWVSRLIAGIPDLFQENCPAIGITRGNQLICGIVYSNYQVKIDKAPLSIEMSIAAIDKRWATRHNIKQLLAYPFIQLGLERVQLTTPVHNVEANALADRLGFQKEGYHRKAGIHGEDVISRSMLRDECGWLNGQRIVKNTKGPGPRPDSGATIKPE